MLDNGSGSTVTSVADVVDLMNVIGRHKVDSLKGVNSSVAKHYPVLIVLGDLGKMDRNGGAKDKEHMVKAGVITANASGY